MGLDQTAGDLGGRRGIKRGEPLAQVLDQLGWKTMSQLIGLAAFLALPSVILMMLFGQTRIFFVMARDRLLPFSDSLSKVHPRYGTPYVVTIITGLAVTVFSAFFPVGVLADISNSGTLFAFLAVSIGVPPRRINEIVHGKRGITADTAMRLAKYFGTSAEFWMNLQAHFELRTQARDLESQLALIQPLQTA